MNNEPETKATDPDSVQAQGDTEPVQGDTEVEEIEPGINILVITDGVFNNYSILDKMSFKNCNEILLYDRRFAKRRGKKGIRNPTDNNQLENYFEENCEKKVILVKSITDLKKVSRVMVFKINDSIDIPFLKRLIKKGIDIPISYHCSPKQSYFMNFREIKSKRVEQMYVNMGLGVDERKAKKKVSERIKKMKSNAKSSKKKRATRKIELRQTLKSVIKLQLEEEPVFEAYD